MPEKPRSLKKDLHCNGSKCVELRVYHYALFGGGYRCSVSRAEDRPDGIRLTEPFDGLTVDLEGGRFSSKTLERLFATAESHPEVVAAIASLKAKMDAENVDKALGPLAG